MESRSREVTRIVPGRKHRVIKERRAEGQVWARGHRALTAAWTPGAAGQVEARVDPGAAGRGGASSLGPRLGPQTPLSLPAPGS